MRKITLNVLFITCSLFILKAQTFTTPEVFSFKQEVFRPISYYTGQANISVPLCQIQTNEITIPISINYIGGEGLRALNPYSSVGFGWKLSAGGVITRTRNNICDECIVSTSGADSDYGTKGFFHLAESSVTTTNDYVRNNVNSYFTSNYTNTTGFNLNYDYSPDIFSFNFLGYSGYFVMGLDKEFHIQSSDIVSVEKLSSNLSGIGDYIIYFKLTANDGTIFTFGSSTGSIEVSGGQYPNVPFQSNAWYLSEIEFPNGSNIYFNYKPNNNYQACLHFQTSSNQSVPNTINPVVLDNITFNGGKVVFTSTPKLQYISNYPDYLRLIDKIELQNESGETVSQINLTYSNTTNQRYYMLDDLSVDDKHYAFEYNSPNSLPSMSQAYGTDYWGFYNGQPETVANIVSGYRDQYLNQTLTLPEKMPSETHAKLGILTSLTYPTGGVESYEYESNTYSYAGIQTLGGYYNSFSQEYKVAGGLRVAKITLGNQVRKYKYVTSFDPDYPDNPGYVVASSGILYKIPAVAFRTEPEALNFLSIEGEPHIVYCKVIEFLSDKSYTEYNLYSPLNRPDGVNDQNVNHYSVNAAPSDIFNDVFESTFVGALGKNSSCALERGQISEIKIYDSSNTLKKSTAYTYSSDPNRYNNYVAALYFAGTGVPSTAQRMSSLGFELGQTYLNGNTVVFSLLHSYCFYTFPVQLEEKIVTEYYGTDIVQNITKYGYNNEKLKSKIVSYGSGGDSIKTQYYYPHDYDNKFSTLKTKNIIGKPIDTRTYNNNQLNSGTQTEYNNYGQPVKTYSLEQKEGDEDEPFDPTTPYTFTHKADYNYNINNRLKEVEPVENITTSYIWAYNNTYPVVKGENVSQAILLSAVNTAVSEAGSTNIDDLFADVGDMTTDTQKAKWEDFIESLLNNSSLESALITTYTYKPLIGVTSQTDPAGRTTYYEYDAFNRLQTIKDHNKDIVEQYKYHYSGEGGYTPPPLFLTASPSSKTFSEAGGSQLITVSSNVNWTVSEPSWFTITGGSGVYNGSFYINAPVNNATTRNETVTITGEGGVTETVLVTQDGIDLALIESSDEFITGTSYNPILSKEQEANTELYYYFNDSYYGDPEEVLAQTSAPSMVSVSIEYDYRISGWIDLTYDPYSGYIEFEINDPVYYDTIYAVIEVSVYGIKKYISIAFDSYP